MNACERILELLEAVERGPLDAEQQSHLASCASCREALERSREISESARLIDGIEPSPALIARIKAMPRFRPACEQSLEWIGEALDGELEAASRKALGEHLHSCAICARTWEALATLHEVGRATLPSRRLHAALAIHPSARVALRRERSRAFDLRLATAAAYLLAALTIMLIGNPASLARASSESVEKASLYARAAVENRVDSLGRSARERLLEARDWAIDTASDWWSDLRRMVSPDAENPSGGKPVEPGENGGTS